MSETSPFVSVVVPTFNRAESLARLLQALSRQTLSPDRFEVIVVNDGSTDPTVAVVTQAAKDYPVPLRLVNTPHQGVAAARNAGVASAQGELVAFTDDDCVPEPDWLSRLVQTLSASPTLVGVGGLSRLMPSGQIIADYYNAYGVIARPGFHGQEVIYLITCNAIFRKAVLLAAGGFDPAQNPASEDVALSISIRRQGGLLGFEPAAVVHHYHQTDFKSFVRTQFNYGRGEMIRLRFDPPAVKIARLVYRSRQFFLWLLLPWDWLQATSKNEWSRKQKFLFPLLEHARQTLLVLGQWREARHLFSRPKLV